MDSEKPFQHASAASIHRRHARRRAGRRYVATPATAPAISVRFSVRIGRQSAENLTRTRCAELGRGERSWASWVRWSQASGLAGVHSP